MDELTAPCDISYPQFYQKYLVGNRPCILRGYLNPEEWRASEDWVQDGKPKFEFFLENFAQNLEVPVSYCNKKYFNSQVCETETLGEYYKYWCSPRSELKYLKDWHFEKDALESKSLITYRAYSTPEFFSNDWLNEWLDFRETDAEENRTDYRFVYIGPKGSFTPLHTDVFGSFSWSANITGVKKWIFLPPGEEKKVETSPMQFVFDILSAESADLQDKHGPVERIEVIQNSGDLIFVPSGWYHQVHNEEDTISINHNWFNGANIQTILFNLNTQLSRVEQEIWDCREDPQWNHMCQNLLRDHHGMNHKDLLDLLILIVRHRSDSTPNAQTDKVGKDALMDLQVGKDVLINLLKKLEELGLQREADLAQSSLHTLL